MSKTFDFQWNVAIFEPMVSSLWIMDIPARIIRFETPNMINKRKNMFRYVLICINDLLLITGSVITEMLETRKTTGDLWDFCSIFLGTGNLLVWIGMLRYLGFFATYNALILTLKGIDQCFRAWAKHFKKYIFGARFTTII